MARGMIGGMVFGGAVSLAAAVAIAVALDPPVRPDAVTQVPDTAVSPAATSTADATDTARTDADVVRDEASPPDVSDTPEDVAAVTEAGADTPQVPETDASDSASADLDSGPVPEGAAVTAQITEPVLPSPQAALPAPPGSETELSISTDPTQPPAPAIDVPQVGAAVGSVLADTQGPAQELALAAPEVASPDPGLSAPAAPDVAAPSAPVSPEVATAAAPPPVASQTDDTDEDAAGTAVAQEGVAQAETADAPGNADTDADRLAAQAETTPSGDVAEVPATADDPATADATITDEAPDVSDSEIALSAPDASEDLDLALATQPGTPTRPSRDVTVAVEAAPDVAVNTPDLAPVASGGADADLSDSLAPSVETQDAANAPDETGPAAAEPGEETAPVIAEAPDASETDAAETGVSEAGAPAQNTQRADAEPRGDERTPPVVNSAPETGADAGTDTAPGSGADPATGARVAQVAPRASIGRPATSFFDRDPEEPSEDTAAVEAPVVSDSDRTDGPPLRAHAVPFENPEGKPLMSIVLIDGGGDLNDPVTGLPALRGFPHALTIAIDATRSDATQRMRDVRAAGYEVMAMLDLPPGATATDAEVNLAAALDALPQAVALIEGPEAGVQDNRAAAEQIVTALQATGHGVVLNAKGLNSAQKLAERLGVPSALVFRDFDRADQTPVVIRRFLDQAAFRAGQQSGVIMLGRLRADTVEALRVWGGQDRIGRVAVSPVSALLVARLGPE